jgi:hypothetical protein
MFADWRLGPVRRLILFVLGVAVIIDGIIQPGANWAELITGLVLLGLVPVDTLLTSRRQT